MKNYYSEIEKKIVVENDPFEFCSSSDFLPIDIANKAETEFVDFDKTIGSGNERYQKLKRGFSDYSKMPSTVKEIIDFFRDLDPNVGLLLDVAHLKVSSNSEKFNLIEGYKKIYPLIDAFHLSDNNGEKDSNSIIKKNSWFLKRLKKNLDYYSIEVYIDDIKKLKKQIELVNKYL